MENLTNRGRAVARKQLHYLLRIISTNRNFNDNLHTQGDLDDEDLLCLGKFYTELSEQINEVLEDVKHEG